MPNPNKLGESSALYYQLADFDTTQADAAILADAGWSDLCVVDVSISRSRDVQEIIDRCVGEDKEYVPGKRDTSISINLNELRLTDAMIRSWHTLADTSGIIALLVLDDERTEGSARGLVGNFIVETDEQTQPSAGSITQALTFRPAAVSTFTPKVDRVYGANIA